MERNNWEELLHLSSEEIAVLAAGEDVPKDLQEWAEEHLLECEECRSLVESMKKIEQMSQKNLPALNEVEMACLLEKLHKLISAEAGQANRSIKEQLSEKLNQDSKTDFPISYLQKLCRMVKEKISPSMRPGPIGLSAVVEDLRKIFGENKLSGHFLSRNSLNIIVAKNECELTVEITRRLSTLSEKELTSKATAITVKSVRCVQRGDRHSIVDIDNPITMDSHNYIQSLTEYQRYRHGVNNNNNEECIYLCFADSHATPLNNPLTCYGLYDQSVATFTEWISDGVPSKLKNLQGSKAYGLRLVHSEQ